MGRKKLDNGEVQVEKPVESKRDKFIRLARRRVPQAIKAIERVANLFKRGTYDYVDEHASKTLAVLKAALDKIMFNVQGSKEPPSLFNLD